MVIDFVIRELEFDRVLKKLAGFALSEQGYSQIKKLIFLDNEEEIRVEQNKYSVFSSLLEKGKELKTAGGVYITLPAVFSYENCLSGQDLVSLHKNYQIAKKLQKGLKEFPVFKSHFEKFENLSDFENKVSAMLAESGEVKENATSELKKLHDVLRSSQRKVVSVLNKIIASNGDIVMEQVVTKRADRYVIPIKRDFKGRMQCLVHDSSGSGSTLFVEPVSVVDLNNEIIDVKRKIELEEKKILLLISEIAINNQAVFKVIDEIIGYFDSLFARYGFAKKYNFIIPEVSRNNQTLLKQAKHPLLVFNGNPVVSNDILQDESNRVLIVSGSNTGGKTVFLKTCGLLQMMCQCVIPVPVAETGCFRVFSNILTDIGDRQSIEESLSTFSSHLIRLKTILKTANSNSLVLIDELGTGTEPVDGAALGRQVVYKLIENKCFAVITTHHQDISTIAYEKDSATRIASVEFDKQAFKPTYKLFYDVPGQSHALDIAMKIGFDKDFIKKAKEYSLDKSGKDLSQMSMGLAEKLKQQEKYNLKLSLELQRALQLRKMLEAREKELLAEKKELERLLNNEFSKFIHNFRREKEKVFFNISKKTRKQAELLEKKAKLEFEKKFINKVHLNVKQKKSSFEKGDVVKHILFGVEGEVGEVKFESGKLEMLVSGKSMWVNSGDVELVKKRSAVKKHTQGKVVVSSNEQERIYSIELNVVGKTVDDAMLLIEKAIDSAILDGMDSILVIHGHGTGKLRKGIRDELKRLPYVEKFESAKDNGATVIYF
jgi:DNA mismatch repair protein MutS2